jgi:HK97 family phage major capsid protein
MNAIAQKLTDRMVKISARAERITLSAVDENRRLTDDEKAEVLRLIADFNEIGTDLHPDDFSPVNSVAAAETWLNTSRGRKIEPQQVSQGSALTNAAPRELAYGKKPTFANMFGAPRDTGGFRSMDEFLRVAGSQRYDPRLKIMDASMSESSGSGGGWLIPDQYVQQLWDSSLESEIVRGRATCVPMLGKTAMASGFDTLNHTGGAIGGFTMQWLGELATGTRQKATVRMVNLNARKGAIFCQASNELYADAPNFASDLETTLIQAMGWSLDQAAISGTGVGQPLGALNDPALITVSAEGGQAADSFLAPNILKMFGRLHPACAANAVWMTNSTCLPKLLSLYIPATNIAGSEYVGAVTGPLVTIVGPNQYLMMGLPLIVTEKAQALGDKGDLMLVDWSQYALGLRREITIERSNAAGWTEDATDWRAIIRVDGQGKWNAPVTPVNGDTLSWCVTLEAR